ncbi:F-box/WD-40 repeat-containing protein [Spatholobus suberectus]|nr:F-box/WD-40 repeat-containing protein [Spatholobus suberectus]
MSKRQRSFLAAATAKKSPSPATGHKIKKRRETLTLVLSLDPDIMCTIFAFLDMFDLVRYSVVCKLWNAIVESRSLREFCERKMKDSSVFTTGLFEFTKKSLRVILEEKAMEQHRLALQCGGFYIDQWKGHSTT